MLVVGSLRASFEPVLLVVVALPPSERAVQPK